MTFKATKLGRKLEARGKSIFGTTQNPINAGYITRDGKYLNFPHTAGAGEEIPDRSHFRVMHVLSKDNKTSSFFINETGDIRTQITKNNANFEIRSPLTQEQFNTMQEGSKGKNIYIDYTNEKGETIKSAKFSDFAEAKHWITTNVRD